MVALVRKHPQPATFPERVCGCSDCHMHALPLFHHRVYRELTLIPSCAIASGMILKHKDGYNVPLMSVLTSPKKLKSSPSL